VLRPPSLKSVIDRLRRLYGHLPPPGTSDPFEVILRENAAYLVDDERREAVFSALAKEIGLTPEAILDAPFERIVAVIRPGGMRPEDRASKLLDCASIAAEVGGAAALLALARDGSPTARKILRRFPGIGEPGADWLVLLAGGPRSLAPDSNALRVLVRLGFAKEEKDYGRTYRAASASVAAELPRDSKGVIEARQLLRRHGQELCRRSDPRCDLCPLERGCAFKAGRAR